MNGVQVDHGAIAVFVETLFRYCDDGGHVALRAFKNNAEGVWRPELWTAPQISEQGLGDVVSAAIALAEAAGRDAEGVVFCPPVATFRSADGAAQKDILNGPALSIDCDEAPEAAREKLENALGPATVTVASGGLWLDPESGAVQEKVHLHWRLTEPTRDFADHMKLKEARRLAMKLVGADASAVPLVHPLRWPGSLHRKGAPRLARIVNLRDDIEIELGDALEQLQEAVAAMPPGPKGGGNGNGKGYDNPDRKPSRFGPAADALDIIAALAVIANDEKNWKRWSDIGMAVWRASGGSEAGYSALIAWSSKFAGFDLGATRERWEHFGKYPPTAIGAGTLFHLAREAWPEWEKPSIARRRRDNDPGEPPPHIVDPQLDDHDDKAPKAKPAAPTDFPDLDTLIAYFNSRFAVVNEAGKALIYELVVDPVLHRRVLQRIGFEDFKKMFLNRLHTKVAGQDKNGKDILKTATWANWWLTHRRRRQYLGGVVFDPTNRAPADCWNLWTGFKVEPQEGDWHLMREHVEQVICGDDPKNGNYLLNTCARMFQFPDRPGEVAAALRGQKGCGKGIFLNYLCEAWGAHGIHISNPAHLVGNFNAHLRDCVMLFADEAFFAGDRQHEGVLKALITEPTLPIEGKYQNVVAVANLLHVFMASNSDWVAPASLVERRWFVLDVPDTRCGDLPYFKAIAAEMERGGLAAMIWDFLHRDISAFEPRAVPQTLGLRAQKLLSLDSLRRWWLAVLSRGFVWKARYGAEWFRDWQGFYTTELLWRSYLQWCAETRPYDRKTREQLGSVLTEIYKATRKRAEHPIYEVDSVDVDPVEKRGNWLDEHSIVRRARATGYDTGTLEEARVRFTEVVDIDTEWGMSPGDDDAVE